MSHPRSLWPLRWSWGVALAAACSLFPCWTTAQESQEPQGPPEEEAPGTTEEDSLNISEELLQVIDDYFAALSDSGYLTLYDELKEQTLKLNRFRAHDEIKKTGDHTYAVCVDARTEADHLYDLDFFIEKLPSGLGSVIEVAIHKDADQPRYVWEEKAGVWSRKVE